MGSGLTTIASAAPAIAMIAAFACVIGGGWLIVSRRERTKGVLMLVMAVVLVGNVLVWTM